jgi:hypothetical protein
METLETERLDVFNLKDGRTIFKTNNGFKYWLESKSGEVIEITEQYYYQAKSLYFSKSK